MLVCPKKVQAPKLPQGDKPYTLVWFSHFFVEHNRPATFGHPFWSWWFDQKMVALMLVGKMGEEVRRCAQQK